jgi:hypothetical protein
MVSMLDLKALAGDRYRISLDPSAEIDTCRENRVWYYRIPARNGFISVHGPDTLAGFTHRKGVIPRLCAIEGVRVYQRGDSEARILFDPSRLDAVADVLKARKRVRLSPEDRQRRSERMKSLRKTIATDP